MRHQIHHRVPSKHVYIYGHNGWKQTVIYTWRSLQDRQGKRHLMLRRFRLHQLLG